MVSKKTTSQDNQWRIYAIALLSAIGGGFIVAAVTARIVGLLPLSFFPDPSLTSSHISTVAQQASAATVSIIGKTNDEKIAGSGFIVSSSGYIVTCAHVVSDQTASYTVTTSGGKTYPVTIIARDTPNDVALLKVDAPVSMPVLPLGNSETLQQGDPVITIGNPYGMLSGTITSGVISGINRSIVAQSPDTDYSQPIGNLIQIDAPINPGESGGPVLNASGYVIGMSEASDTRAQNLSFAVSVNSIKQVLDTYNIS